GESGENGESGASGALLAVFFVQDTLKEDAGECVQKLQAMGLDVCIASGDRQAPVARVANALGITHFYANQTPDSKAQLIESLQAQGKTILMVGDGINDTIAFAKSNAAIAMGSGVDVAISVSDVVVLDNTLQSICDALNISRASLRAIRQNLAISIVYNALTIPLAMAGFVIPLIAAASMSLSSLLVVGNSLRNKA
ncbi:MAG: HAD-IC family P-type ATPase, partial [Helicobacter sp.]|nr:HAD-IC family P-type ATPase [Helicobacter sp.]